MYGVFNFKSEMVVIPSFSTNNEAALARRSKYVVIIDTDDLLRWLG